MSKNSSTPKIDSMATLTIPVRGLNRNVHEIVSRMPGTINGTMAISRKNLPNGTFVRSTSQANVNAITKASNDDPMAKTNEFFSVGQVNGLVNASM